MIVCVCHRVTDRDIAREARGGCRSFDELQDTLRVATACGACLECAQDTFAGACSGQGPCHAWPARDAHGQAAPATVAQRRLLPVPA